MTAPKRIQLRRTAGWRKPEGAVSVARPGRFGNPWKADTPDGRPGAVERFVRHLEARRTPTPGWHDFAQYPSDDEIRAELAGRDLMCWCPLPDPGQPDHCHAAALIELANTPEGAS